METVHFAVKIQGSAAQEVVNNVRTQLLGDVKKTLSLDGSMGLMRCIYHG